MPIADSYRSCEALARRTGKNFYYSFLTLPRDRYDAMCALYAFMRVTDDLGDSGAPAVERKAALARWREEFEQAWSTGETANPILPAVVDMLRRYNVPKNYLTDVVSGVEMDLHPVSIVNFEELNRYCYHVAGAVGLACIHVWGFHDERAIPAAVDCGTALQLTNIVRDVREDALAGRVYLPQVDFERFGVESADLLSPSPSPAVIRLLEFEAARAREFYQKAEPLFEYLDPPGRPILETMLRIYGGLLNKMERRRFDVFSKRVELGSFEKLFLAGRSVVRHKWRQLFNSH